MHQISIATPSDRAFSKMKRGHKVRLSQGSGMTLIVSPQNYSHISRSFLQGRGVHVMLSDDERKHNQAAGIFGRAGDKALRYIGGDRFKDFAYRAGDKAKPYVKKGIKAGLAAAGAAVAASNPEFAPLVPFGVERLSRTADAYLDNPKSFGVGGNLSVSRGPRRLPVRHDVIKAINAYTGENSGKLRLANLGTYAANLAHSQLQAATGGSGLFAEPPGGSGLFAEPSGGGQGLYAQPHPMRASGLRPRRREMGSVGIHGNLLRRTILPYALTPQPFSAKFQFGHTLPPAFQVFAKSGR